MTPTVFETLGTFSHPTDHQRPLMLTLNAHLHSSAIITSLTPLAGIKTRWTTIMMFVFAMTLFPDKQGKAQQEIDAIVGLDRLPGFSDRSSLPYLEAVFQEVLRWYPVVPLVYFQASHTELSKTMFTKEFSSLKALPSSLMWLSMAWDDNIYADPTKFHPKRFLPKSAGGNEEPYPIGTFGFGRRICPGRHVADMSIWIVLTTMLSTSTISKAKDENGDHAGDCFCCGFNGVCGFPFHANHCS